MIQSFLINKKPKGYQTTKYKKMQYKSMYE